MKTKAWMRLVMVLALGVGCSEGETTPMGTDAGTDAGVDAGTDVDSSTEVDSGSVDSGSVDSGSDVDAGDVDGGTTTSALVINEVSVAGDDWIEVKNVGGRSLDVGGWIVTQLDAEGMPEPERSAPFPAGFTIAPGGYFVVVTDQDAPLEGIQTECMVEGVSECLIAEFGISAGDGDILVVLDASGTEAHRAVYPGGAVTAGRTWSRLPDGTGDFVVGVPTPAAPNAIGE